MTKPSEKTSEFNFEQALAELQQLVTNMEQGELSLENSVQTFERGMQLSKQCQQALAQAEQKVQILMQKNSQQTLDDFVGKDDDND